MPQLISIRGIPSTSEHPDMRLVSEAARSYHEIYEGIGTFMPFVINSAFRDLAREMKLIQRAVQGDPAARKSGIWSWHNVGRAIDISIRSLDSEQKRILRDAFTTRGWQFQPRDDFYHFELESAGGLHTALRQFWDMDLVNAVNFMTPKPELEQALEVGIPGEGATHPWIDVATEFDQRFADFSVDTVAFDPLDTPQEIQSPGATKIGDLWLYVPPTQITVTEYNTLSAINTVRTIGNPKIYTGQQEIRIELDLFFTDIDDFNRTLRPLIAQARRVPFLPLENDYIRKLLTSKRDPRDLRDQDDLVQGLAELDNIRVANQMGTSNEESHIKIGFSEEKEEDQFITPQETISRGIPERQKEFPDLEPELSDEFSEPIFTNPVAVEADAAKLFGLPYDDEPIPVVIKSMHLSTVPGMVGSVQCILQLNLFNFRPYSADFSFVRTELDAVKQMILYDRLKDPNISDAERLNFKDAIETIPKTWNCSESIPFKKYYQGLLEEYHVESSWDFNGPSDRTTADRTWVPKTYATLPYVPEVRRELSLIMPEASNEYFDQYKFTGVITGTTLGGILEATRQRMKSLRGILVQTIDAQDGDLNPIQNLKNEVKAAWRYLVNYISNIETEIEFAITKIPLELLGARRFRVEGAQLLIFDHLRTQKYVTLDDFMDTVFENSDRTEVNKLIDEYLKITKRFNKGELIATRKITIDLTKEDVVFQQVSAGLDSKLIPIRILSYNVPTYQYIGQNDFICSMNFITSDQQLLHDLRTLSMMAQYTRKVAFTQAALLTIDERARRALIYQDNALVLDDVGGSNLLQSLGIKRVMVGDVTYQSVKGHPNTFSVSMTLHQADTDLMDHEVLINRTPASLSNVQRILSWLQVTSSTGDIQISDPGDRVFIDEIIDGDTFSIQGTTSNVRLLGVDTPETVAPFKPIQTGGPEAREFVQRLIGPNKLAILRRDPLSPDKDRGNRLLRYVEFPESGVEDVGELLLKEGFAVFESRFPFIKYLDYARADRLSPDPGPDTTLGDIEPFRAERRANVLQQWEGLRSLIGDIRESRRQVEAIRAEIDADNALFEGIDRVRTPGLEAHAGTVIRVPRIGQQFDAAVITTHIRVLEYELQQKIKLYLLDPAFVDAINEELQTAGIKFRIPVARDSSIVSTYKDLQLPQFTQFGLNPLSTPADFYFHRYNIVDPSALQLIVNDIRRKQDYIAFLEHANRVVRGEATNKDLRAKIPFLVEEMTKARDRNDREELNELRKMINGLSDEITLRLSDQSVPVQERLRQTVEKEIRDQLKSIEQRLGNDGRTFNESLEAAKQLATSNLSEGKGDISTIQSAIEVLKIRKQELQEIAQGVHGSAAADSIMAYTWGSFTREAQEETINAIANAQNVLGRTRLHDNSFHMSRAYPTFALYFVEEDAPEWLLFNDLYGYDAIESIDILSDREQATETAVVRLSNLTGILTSDTAQYVREHLEADSTTGEQSLSSVFLQPGTRIVIKMGFENNPDKMPILFDGAIVSINPGDIVEIVCQSWGAHLTRPIGVNKPLHMNWKSHAASYGHVVTRILDDTGIMRHYGGRSLFNDNPLRPSQRKRSLWSVAFTDPILLRLTHRLNVPRFQNYILKNAVDDNIYLDYAPPWGYELELIEHPLDPTITKRQINSLKAQIRRNERFSWYIYRQTAWNAINEVLLYHPEYIVKSMPYNEERLEQARQTLYIGPWNGYYKYTDRFNQALDATISELEIEEFRRQADFLQERFPELKRFDTLEQGLQAILKPTFIDRLKLLPRGQDVASVIAGFIGRGLLLGDARIAAQSTPLSEAHTGIISQALAKLSQIVGIDVNAQDFFQILDRQTTIRRQIEALKGGFLRDKILTNNPKEFVRLPGYKRLTSTHIVTSRNHIMVNNIRADATNIYNHIILRYPKKAVPEESEAKFPDRPAEFIVDENIPDEFRRTMVTFQKNISKDWKDHLLLRLDEVALSQNKQINQVLPSYLRVGNNILVNSLRHMYTGELILTLSPQIRTWDKVYMYDDVTQMTGLIGVRKVHHHFDAEQGAWTAITPDLIVHHRDMGHVFEDKYMVNTAGFWMHALFPGIEPNEPVSAADLLDALAGKSSFWNTRWIPGRQRGIEGVLGGIGGVGLGVLATASTGNPLLGAAGGVAGWVSGSFVGRRLANKMWTAGVGWLFNQQAIQLTGVWYKNVPLYAGIEGFRRENFLVQLGHLVEPYTTFFGESSRVGNIITAGKSFGNLRQVR